MRKLRKRVLFRLTVHTVVFTTLVTTFYGGTPQRPAEAQQYPGPIITSLSPSEVQVGQSVELNISGKYFLQGAKLHFSPATGVNVTWLKWVSPQKISAGITVAKDAAVGTREITITNPDGQSAVLRTRFRVTTTPVGAGSIRLTPEKAENLVCTTHRLMARVLDAAGKPLAGVKVTFTVTGANPTSGIGITDSSGDASFAFHGAKPGDDRIVATANNLAAVAYTHWTVKDASKTEAFPVDKIVEANARILRYHLRIEDTLPGLVQEGEVDETAKALFLTVALKRGNVPPVRFFQTDNKGYGQHSFSKKWLRVFVPERFPNYLGSLVELLKQKEIALVRSEGGFWKIDLRLPRLPLQENPDEFWRKIFEPRSPQDTALINRIIEESRHISLSSHLLVAQKDYRITQWFFSITGPCTNLAMTFSFSPEKAPIPSLPAEAQKAPQGKVPLVMLFSHLTSIQGWCESTHLQLAEASIGLIRQSDRAGRYGEIYHGELGSTATTGTPSETNHPLLIGAQNEDNTGTFPDFYNRWFAPEPEYYFKNNYFRDYHHFGGESQGLQYEPFFEWRGAASPTVGNRYHSARDWGYGGERINPDLNRLTFIEAIKQYDRYTFEGKRNAYLMMGHVLHLLQDQAMPDHAALIAHPGSSMSESRAYNDEMYICLIIGGGVAANALIFCAAASVACLAWYPLCFAGCVAGVFAVAVAGCYAFRYDEDDLGYEKLVDVQWTPSRIREQIIATGVLKPDGYRYDDYFGDIARFSKERARGFGQPLGMTSVYIPVFEEWLIEAFGLPSIPSSGYVWIDPDIDSDDPRATRPYLDLTDSVAKRAICMGAGLLEYFYEIANHPPYIKSVMVVEGGEGTPVLFDRGAISSADIRYHAHWIDRFNLTPLMERLRPNLRQTKKRLERRDWRIERNEPVRAQKQSYIFIELGPSIHPEKGKIAGEIRLTVGDTPVPLNFKQTRDGKPYYMGKLPLLICEEREVTLPVQIQAWDQSAHLAARTPSGSEIDANPETVARTAVSSGGAPSDPLSGYEPGPDTHHRIRFAPARWRIDVSPSNRERPPIRVSETHTVHLTVQSVTEVVPAPGATPVEMWLPGASCSVRWELDNKVFQIVGSRREEGTASGYHFRKILLTNPTDPITQLILQPGPETPGGRYAVVVNHTIGRRRTGSTEVIFEVIR